MNELARPEEDANWEMYSTSQKIAWKTGTSFGFRDAWAVGVTPKYVVGVWVGNADGEGRPGLIGREVAAPIMFDVFQRYQILTGSANHLMQWNQWIFAFKVVIAQVNFVSRQKRMDS